MFLYFHYKATFIYVIVSEVLLAISTRRCRRGVSGVIQAFYLCKPGLQNRSIGFTRDSLVHYNYPTPLSASDLQKIGRRRRPETLVRQQGLISAQKVPGLARI